MPEIQEKYWWKLQVHAWIDLYHTSGDSPETTVAEYFLPVNSKWRKTEGQRSLFVIQVIWLLVAINLHNRLALLEVALL